MINFQETLVQCYKKGLAVGESRILTDTVFFRFKEETFEFPSNEVVSLVLNWGTYPQHNEIPLPVAKVSALRKLAKQSKKA